MTYGVKDLQCYRESDRPFVPRDDVTNNEVVDFISEENLSLVLLGAEIRPTFWHSVKGNIQNLLLHIDCKSLKSFTPSVVLYR